MRALYITSFTVCVLFVVKTTGRTCDSLDIRNNVTQFEKLRNCTVVAGYLQIVLFEKTAEEDFENISFPELKEINGFLLFYRIKGLKSIGSLFPNLSVIRGLELFMDYALIIYDMRNLEEIGLYSLSSILRGSTRIEKNPLLCYISTIDWLELGDDPPFLALNHDPNQCPTGCPPECSKPKASCWNSQHCQTVISSECHSECVNGCNGPNDDQCIFCKNLRNENRCVSKCSSDKYLLSHQALCVTKEYCKALTGTWWTFQGECINTCPAKYKNVSPKEGHWDCEYCGSNCPKVCSAMQVDSISAAQTLKGCTYINGSLHIRIEGNKNIEDELEKNLGMIEEIDGFLKVHRSFSIRSLGFLKKLRVIHGRELDKKKYSIIVQQNENLQTLWDWENFKLQVNKGNFSFHYNPKLCISEIEKLQNVTKLKSIDYKVDVSIHSNGDKFACNHVNLFTKIYLTGPSEIDVSWETHAVPNKEALIGYLIYYIEAPDRNVSAYDRDACGEHGWRIVFVSNSNDSSHLNQTITLLKPFTQYALHVSTAYSTGKGGQSPLQYFKTLSDDPSVPMNIQAKPAGSNAIVVTWERPTNINGILSHYIILAYLQQDDQSFIDLRNYCKYRLQEVKQKPVYTQISTEASVNKTRCCKKDNSITVIQKQDFDAICTDLDKYKGADSGKSQGCGSYTYHVIQNPLHKHGESSEENMMIQKRQDTSTKSSNEEESIKKEGVYHFLTKEVNGNQSSYEISGLKHYSIYILLLRACNENRTEKVQCSSVVMVSQRTGRKGNADDIDSLHVALVDVNAADIRWIEPTNPNAVIVSYHVEYRNLNTQNRNSIISCVTREEHEKHNHRYTIRHLAPGNYSVRVKATSLAGDGNYTKYAYFYIAMPAKSSSIIHIVVSIVVIFLITTVLAIYFWYRRKHQLDNVQLIANVNPDYAGYIEDDWEIDRDNIKLLQELGQGTFGTVYNGIVKDKNMPCAIKTVHEKAEMHDKMEFLNEASVMKSFNDAHHVVRLLGVVSRGPKPFVVMELMARGDLKTFLRSTRDSSTCLTCSEMYRMAAEIADGMAYLSAKKFVHRDLAARNCMVSADHTVKIGDFGMTRDIYETDYYRKETRGLLPVRWMSPESLADGVFAAESDVWSYGIVLWEIATLAEQPYQGLANEQVLQYVIAKGTLERPLQCPDLLYDIMEACWKWRPSNRPLFTDIVDKLESHVGQDFKLVSFYHSRDGEEFRMTKRDLNKAHASAMPAYGNLTAHWTKENDEANCYLGTSSRNVVPLSSYHSSNGFMSYPLSSK